MHYKNRREVKIGDKVVGKDSYSGNPFCGIVGNAVAESTSCNIIIFPLSTLAVAATASECLHIEDVLPNPST